MMTGYYLIVLISDCMHVCERGSQKILEGCHQKQIKPTSYQKCTIQQENEGQVEFGLGSGRDRQNFSYFLIIIQRTMRDLGEYGNNISCEHHPSEPILFVCISHLSCPLKNLLCIECVDELGKSNPHQLLSLKKFQKFGVLYSDRAHTKIEQLRYSIKKLRQKLNHQLDLLQQSSIGLLTNYLPTMSTSEKFRESIAKIAELEVWSKMNEIKDSEALFEKQMNDEISKCCDPVFDIIDRVLKTFRASTKQNFVDQIIFEAKNKIINEGNDRAEKKVQKNNGEMEAENVVDDEMDSENNQMKKKSKSPSGNSLPFEFEPAKSKSNRKIKRNRTGKQFSEEQKLKIVNKIGKTMTKSKLAKDYNIAYSTLRKWELMFLPNERVVLESDQQKEKTSTKNRRELSKRLRSHKPKSQQKGGQKNNSNNDHPREKQHSSEIKSQRM